MPGSKLMLVLVVAFVAFLSLSNLTYATGTAFDTLIASVSSASRVNYQNHPGATGGGVGNINNITEPAQYLTITSQIPNAFSYYGQVSSSVIYDLVPYQLSEIASSGVSSGAPVYLYINTTSPFTGLVNNNNPLMITVYGYPTSTSSSQVSNSTMISTIGSYAGSAFIGRFYNITKITLSETIPSLTVIVTGSATSSGTNVMAKLTAIEPQILYVPSSSQPYSYGTVSPITTTSVVYNQQNGQSTSVFGLLVLNSLYASKPYPMFEYAILENPVSGQTTPTDTLAFVLKNSTSGAMAAAGTLFQMNYSIAGTPNYITYVSTSGVFTAVQSGFTTEKGSRIASISPTSIVLNLAESAPTTTTVSTSTTVSTIPSSTSIVTTTVAPTSVGCYNTDSYETCWNWLCSGTNPRCGTGTFVTCTCASGTASGCQVDSVQSHCSVIPTTTIPTTTTTTITPSTSVTTVAPTSVGCYNSDSYETCWNWLCSGTNPRCGTGTFVTCTCASGTVSGCQVDSVQSHCSVIPTTSTTVTTSVSTTVPAINACNAQYTLYLGQNLTCSPFTVQLANLGQPDMTGASAAAINVYKNGVLVSTLAISPQGRASVINGATTYYISVGSTFAGLYSYQRWAQVSINYQTPSSASTPTLVIAPSSLTQTNSSLFAYQGGMTSTYAETSGSYVGFSNQSLAGYGITATLVHSGYVGSIQTWTLSFSASQTAVAGVYHPVVYALNSTSGQKTSVNLTLTVSPSSRSSQPYIHLSTTSVVLNPGISASAVYVTSNVSQFGYHTLSQYGIGVNETASSLSNNGVWSYLLTFNAAKNATPGTYNDQLYVVNVIAGKYVYANLSIIVRPGAVATTTVPAKSPTPPCGSYGDLNNDGVVNATDVSLVSDCIMGQSDCTSQMRTRADVNNDGAVNVLDLTLIERYVAGSVSTFPACTPASTTTAPATTITTTATTSIPTTIFQYPTYTVTLNRGWNLFSVPLEYATKLNTTCAPGGIASPIWQLVNGQYEQASSVYGGIGYWVKSNNECSVTFSGPALTIDELPSLSQGWNLIGAFSYPTAFKSIAGTCSATSLMGFNPDANSYYSVSVSSADNVTGLLPGYGYFVKVSAACKLGSASALPPPVPT